MDIPLPGEIPIPLPGEIPIPLPGELPPMPMEVIKVAMPPVRPYNDHTQITSAYSDIRSSFCSPASGCKSGR